MNEVTLPPSPNWYLTTILSCARDGTVAWGSKNMIVVSKPPGVITKARDYSIITDAHTDRVSSVSFCPDYGPGKRLLLSGGDENIIRIWDLETMSAVQSQSYLDSKQKVVGVDWSVIDPNHVICVSADGVILSWNTSFSACQTITLGKMTATCIRCCPHKSNIVAVGTKAGLVYIVNLQGSGSIIYKLRGHDTEITSLSWCPSKINIFNDGDGTSEDLLLASGAKDKSVFIWRAGGDGRYESQFTLPSAPQDSNQHRSKLSGSGHFTALCWIEPKCLLASSSFGELLAMDLGSGKKTWRLIHGHHARGIFSITSVPSADDHNENWRKSSRLVWTTAQDRQVVCSSINGNECHVEHSVPTQGGFIYCMASCPLDTSLIAYGSGDMVLRLWNLTEPHENSVNVTCMWQKIMGRVTAIAWHPTEENILAFGTAEGRVGAFDTNNTTKLPTLYRQHHRRTVYSLAWAPRPGSTKYGLYSCADNELVCFNPEKANEAPQVVIKKDCTEFAWKPDFGCVAIGFEDGSIFFKDRELKACGKPIFLLKKAVQCIAWHPDSTLTDLEFSPMRNYMAVSTNTNKITIFDMTIMIDSPKGNENGDTGDKEVKDTVTHKVVCTLSGHADRVISLGWNPHISGQLVSGSYDSTAQVWNIETQALIATYTGHRGPVYSCMWSPVNSDLIITGSVDFSLRIWRISDQQVVMPVMTEVKKNKSKNKKSKNSKTGVSKPMECEASIASATVESSESLTSELGQLSIKSETKVTRDKKTKKTFLPVYRKMMNNKDIALQNCLKIAQKMKTQSAESSDNTDGDNDADDLLSIFGDEKEMMSVIKNELTTFTSQGQHTMATELSLWTGDLRDQLQNAAKERRLNDFMVSLSPMLSMKTWKEMCEAYATQLVLESNITKAVAYFLIIHKIYQAIEVFMEAKMYREAYTLARCKLDSKDQMLTKILEVWESHAAKAGLYEDAAQCSLLLGDCIRAAKFIARRPDVVNLKTAAELAIIAGDSELAESLADQAIIQSLLQSNYPLARNLIEQFPAIRYRLIHLVALEEVNKVRGIDDAFVCSWIEGKTSCDLISTLQKSYQHLEPLEAYGKLVNVTYPVSQDESSLWLSVSHNMALAASNDDQQIYHIVAALGIISQYEIMKPKSEPRISYLLSLLAVLKPFIASFDDEKPIYKSYRAYLCLALSSWLVDKLNGSPESTGNLDVKNIVDIIKKTLPDGLDPAAVKYWTVTSEITKLEASLATTISNSSKDNQEADDSEPTKVNGDSHSSLRERLNKVRSEKKKFIDDRNCVPSPIVIYSKVTELSSLINDEESEFKNIITGLWTKAVS
ncbi:gem-associated protein 5 [Microplitis demolitor]|uniref:gem-associated protein 5 n=1 Tax=Microplitis demolitor TaxID=69319 RepID=UPI0004CD1BBB|nr:gem-associated protein 5 [Microplitis demolitor]